MKHYVRILLLIPIFACCTDPEGERILDELGDFPWDSVPNWIPYVENDTIKMVNQNNESRVYVVESVRKNYDAYQPEKTNTTFCNCEPGPISEYAGINCSLLPYYSSINNDDEDIKYIVENTIEYEWVCHRDLYSFDCNMQINGKYEYLHFNNIPISKYDYNAIFEELPDTLLFFNEQFEVKVIAGKGLIMMKDIKNNETWNIK